MTTFTTEDRIHAYSHYVLLDEYGQAMRTVKSKHEAENLIKTYTDWSYKFVKAEKIDLSNLGEAPF